MTRATEWCWRKLRAISTRKLHLSAIDKPYHPVHHVHHGLWKHKVIASAKACAYVCIPIWGGTELWESYGRRPPPEFMPFQPIPVPEPSTLWLFAGIVAVIFFIRRKSI